MENIDEILRTIYSNETSKVGLVTGIFWEYYQDVSNMVFLTDEHDLFYEMEVLKKKNKKSCDFCQGMSVIFLNLEYFIFK